MYELTDIEDEWAYLTLGGRYGAVSLCRGASEEPDGTEWRLPDEEWIAACRLAGAAPGMLDALYTAEAALDVAQAQVDSDYDRLRLQQWRAGIQDAISKAEGRSE